MGATLKKTREIIGRALKIVEQLIIIEQDQKIKENLLQMIQLMGLVSFLIMRSST